MSEAIVEEHGIPVSRACKIVSLPRSQFYYRSKRNDTTIVESLQELAFKHPSYGFRKLFAYLRRSGKTWNHKKVYRVYKLLKLNKKRKGKRRLPARVKQPLRQQTAINKSWSMDFMSDSMVGNRKFRTFNVIDDCTREVLAIEVDTSLSSRRIIRTLERIIEHRGIPQAVRTDNGPEFTSHHFEGWCREKQIDIQFIQPGKPMQNGYIERFNRLYREAVLDAYLFFELSQVKQLTAEWMQIITGTVTLFQIEWRKDQDKTDETDKMEMVRLIRFIRFIPVPKKQQVKLSFGPGKQSLQTVLSMCQKPRYESKWPR